MVSDKVILGEKDKTCIFFLEEGEMAPNGNFFKKIIGSKGAKDISEMSKLSQSKQEVQIG